MQSLDVATTNTGILLADYSAASAATTAERLVDEAPWAAATAHLLEKDNKQADCTALTTTSIRPRQSTDPHPSTHCPTLTIVIMSTCVVATAPSLTTRTTTAATTTTTTATTARAEANRPRPDLAGP
ncbi:hypothetical protein RRG08_024846 [Elysia crispata]|uniref:Uncharacterized protein n=1 Tax=Elysia crispata TaxID=231223 RepID=A0AAE0YIY6_9GAST|nr:hypothetical protein RRG08_024846 [Elysia crispata]